MSTINDGGPAFPEGLHAANVELAGGRYDGAYVSRYEQIDSGMSLRDYFAAKAPAASQDWVDTQRAVDRSRNPHNDSYKPRLRDEIEIRAAWAYCWADAMLKARQS